MHKIGILSDTHGLLRPEVIWALQGCEAILHGGDINRQDIIDQLNTIAPVYVVRGNNDKDWAEHIPMFLDLHLYGCHICMTHKKKDLPQDLSDYDLVVYGHSHRYEQKSSGKTLLLNPGSCGPRRFHQDITMAIAEVDNCIDSGIDSCADTSSDAKTPNITIQRPDTASEAQTPKITIHRIDIPHEKKSGITRTTTQKPNGKITLETIQTQDIEKIIRMIKKKKSVRYISEQMGMEEDFAEQICRLYLTHPGVTAEGIMTKMGL
jgi:putative phosphoesterase